MMSEALVHDDPFQLAVGWKARCYALLRLFAFLGMGIAFMGVAFFVVIHLLKIKVETDSGLTLPVLLVSQGLQAILMAALPTGIMLRLAHEPATHFGWGRRDRLYHLAIGLASGAGLMTALLAILGLLGVFSFGTLSLSPAEGLVRGLGYALVFVFTAIAEEGFVRGYGLVQLSQAISFWPAAIVTSVIFGALHLTHATETPIALIQAGIVGLVFAYSFRLSGALWFAWGFHAAWDFAQTFVFGVADSGMSTTDALMRSSFHGPDWLTGGSAGPEGSYLALPIMAAAVVIVRVALKPKAAAEL